MILRRTYLLTFFIYIKIINGNNKYKGENFPKHYLEPDSKVPLESDLDFYLDRLTKITSYMMNSLNETDVNQALGTYLTAVVVKKTLQNYQHKLQKQKGKLKTVVRNTANILSHYIYSKRENGWLDTEFRLSKVLRDDTAHVYAMSDFRRNALKPWIYDERAINEFVPSYDNLKLPREKYVELVEAIDLYDIKVKDSDYCLSMLVENIDPIDMKKLRPCIPNKRCKSKIFSSPSVAYTISHRLLNNLMFVYNRRCYLRSPKTDIEHMDMLCAAMFRESVYIARRGYFSRDLILEHIALCGHLGYEEFHRHNWFRKTAGWIDDNGCMQEDANFEINRTRLIVAETEDPKEQKEMRKKLKWLLLDECHHHQMAVAMIVLAHGIRHTAHHMDEKK